MTAHEEGPPPLAAPYWRIYLDVEVTRRKTFHMIVNQQGETVWRARRFVDALDWCRIEDITTVLVIGPDWQRTYRLDFTIFEEERQQ